MTSALLLLAHAGWLAGWLACAEGGQVQVQVQLPERPWPAEPAAAAGGGGGARDEPDPTCAHGVTDEVAEYCCAASCGVCGGEDCQHHPGGQADCCCGAIKTEGRNCSQTGAPCVMPPPPPAPPAPPVRPAHAINAKRGFVGDGGNCNDAVALNVSGWYYGYNVVNPYRSAKAQGDCALANSSAHLDQRFAPMNWCLSSLTTPVRKPRRVLSLCPAWHAAAVSCR